MKFISEVSTFCWCFLVLISFNFISFSMVNPLSTNITKWSNTLKQFVAKLPMNCLSVFDHFVKLALKGLILKSLLVSLNFLFIYKQVIPNNLTSCFLGTFFGRPCRSTGMKFALDTAMHLHSKSNNWFLYKMEWNTGI